MARRTLKAAEVKKLPIGAKVYLKDKDGRERICRVDMAGKFKLLKCKGIKGWDAIPITDYTQSMF